MKFIFKILASVKILQELAHYNKTRMLILVKLWHYKGHSNATQAYIKFIFYKHLKWLSIIII